MSSNYSPACNVETNPLNYFSDRGEDYEKYRPIHPSSAIDTILAGLNTPELVVADIGAGTGIGSRLLANRGIRVLAIEPNADMRASATPHELVEFLAGTAEKIPLDIASVDLVVSFQAFHWFDFIKSLREFHRILKVNGRLALIWTMWDEKDFVSKRYSRLIWEASKDQGRAQPRIQPITLLKAFRYQLFWQGLWLPYFSNLHRHWYSYHQELDLAGLIGLARSQGFVPKEGAALEKLILQLSEFHNRFSDEQGKVRLAYRTSLYLATPKGIKEDENKDK